MDQFQLNIETLLFKRKIESANSITEQIDMCKEFLKKFDKEEEGTSYVPFPNKDSYVVEPMFERIDYNRFEQFDTKTRTVYLMQLEEMLKEKYVASLKEFVLMEKEHNDMMMRVDLKAVFDLDRFMKSRVRLSNRNRYPMR